MEAVGGPALISIVGMHRSGTSALAGALHKLGADLGPPSSWVQPASDNPRGFFEFVQVVDVNRDAFLALGGTWSSPPPLPKGWEEDQRISDIRMQIGDIASTIPERMVVKDPRLSLLQPLWAAATNVVASVLCLRHPMAVADSLKARNDFAVEHGLYLWFRYNAAAMLNYPGALIVEFESLLEDSRVELERVADHLDMGMSVKSLEGAAGTVSPTMSHSDSTELPDTPVGIICGRLYEALRSGQRLEADTTLDIWARLATELPWAGPEDRDISRVRREVTDLRREITRLEADKQRMDGRVLRLESELRQALVTVDSVSIFETVQEIARQEAGEE